jgi:hypothetical protein
MRIFEAMDHGPGVFFVQRPLRRTEARHQVGIVLEEGRGLFGQVGSRDGNPLAAVPQHAQENRQGDQEQGGEE